MHGGCGVTQLVRNATNTSTKTNENQVPILEVNDHWIVMRREPLRDGRLPRRDEPRQ
jgi:hypothetical protein